MILEAGRPRPLRGLLLPDRAEPSGVARVAKPAWTLFSNWEDGVYPILVSAPSARPRLPDRVFQFVDPLPCQ